MSKKRKVAVAGGAAAGVMGFRAFVRASRQRRAARAAEGIAATILPTAEETAHAEELVPVVDEAHAPGHAHLDRRSVQEERPPHLEPTGLSAKQRGGLHQPRRC